MPELPFYKIIPPLKKRGIGGLSLEKMGVKFPLWKRGIKGDFKIDWQARKVKPLCAHPANIPLTLTLSRKGRGNILALTGKQAYRRGLPDEELISGWANVQANNYWSSSTYANNTTNAWNVNMNDGNVNGNNKTNSNYVWPVRAGEWFVKEGNTPLNPLLIEGKSPHLKRTHSTSPPLEKGDEGGFVFSFENLYASYLKCRKGKRNTINALRFEINAEENLLKLSEELENKTYQPIRSVCFIVERPKMREIIAADFRDRVVHHALIERLEAIYEPVFIYDSYACRKDKGLHKAVERVREFIRRGSKNGRERLYFTHLDIRNFFMSIDREILFQMLKKKLDGLNHPFGNPPLSPFSKGGLLESPLSRGDTGVCSPLCQRGVRGDFINDLLYLARAIIFHNPTEDCIIKGKRNLLNCLPPHKSLFHAPEDRGLPIGNLTSQFFANVYLNEIDQYVKHTLKCRYYVRYCDDFLILDKSPERLEEVKRKINDFVKERLHLSLNEKKGKVMPVSNGIDFLGYIIRQDYMLVRRRVVNNLKSRLGWFEKRLVSHSSRAIEQQSSESSFPQYVSGNPEEKLDARLRHSGMTNICLYKYDYELLEKLRSVIASYLGHLKWADTYSLKSAILKRYWFLKEYFSFAPPLPPFSKGGIKGGLKPLYRYYEIFPSVRSQYLYYARCFNDAVLFFQVGCFYEFYEDVKEEVIAILRLERLKENRRGVRYGFPLRLEEGYAKRLVNEGIPVVIIKETDRYIGKIKERLPIMKISKTKEEKHV
jgi:retron-type reverse transcriptase